VVKVWVDRAERERRGSSERAAIVKSSRGGSQGLKIQLGRIGERFLDLPLWRMSESSQDRAAVAPKGEEGSLRSHLICKEGHLRHLPVEYTCPRLFSCSSSGVSDASSVAVSDLSLCSFRRCYEAGF
jgi:hypothetical protein